MESIDKERFERFLWDYGVRLPVPLNLGPRGDAGYDPAGGPEFVVDDEIRRGRWTPGQARALEGLLRVMESPESVVAAYLFWDNTDEESTRVVSAGIIADDEAIVVVETPQGPRLELVEWSHVASAVVGQLPLPAAMALPRTTIPTSALHRIADESAQGASTRSLSRTAVGSGVSLSVFALLSSMVPDPTTGGFACASWVEGTPESLSEMQIDLIISAQGGMIRYGDESTVTFEPLTSTTLTRALGQSMARLPARRRGGLGRCSHTSL
ncbi:hypothetical protein KEM60_03120 [Austwickia sp. TVS 96-490-7B]|uniref:ESX secretion-associated protein EspG n=1 Tax=Austwickia sp. TVS 96-490-7B TaxID=2830843 RepID=UPI001C572BA0|nr:ESX secretion-associated protein EspG [Austwickia sp. TVS 96-490-7B]MBW3086891.1 hypothetical protein [Austwickia sp. TVS 96-490-7B]